MSETIDFKFNKPVLVTLAFAQGKNVPSRFPGSVRILRTTKDARVFFCDPQLEGKIAALNPAPGVQYEITKLERDNSRKGCDWKVERIGTQPDGTYKIPKAGPEPPPQVIREPASAALTRVVTEPPQNITAMQARTPPPRKPANRPTREQILHKHSRVLLDAQVALLKYAADKHPGMVRPDDARSIVLTVYINLGRSVGERRAG